MKGQPQLHPLGVRMSAFKPGQIWQAPAHARPSQKSGTIEVHAIVRDTIHRETSIRFWSAEDGYFDIGMGEVLEDLSLVIQE